MDNDILEIEVDTEDFEKEEVTQMVSSIRKRLAEASIDFITVGKFKYDIHIYLKDLNIKDDILLFLSEHEKSFVSFDKV